MQRDHPALHNLLTKHPERAGSVKDAISMLGQADRDRILVGIQA